MAALSFEMINHFRLINHILHKQQLQAKMDFSDYYLLIHNNERGFHLFPQFQNKKGLYDSVLINESTRFMGWRPHHIYSWETATNKLLFKTLLHRNGISTPNYARSYNSTLGDYIVKPITSSFGAGIKGPFLSDHGCGDVKEDEFCEAYIKGTIAKIWFWRHQAVAAELLPYLSVRGNGCSTIAELIEAHAYSINRKVDATAFLPMLAYQGITLDTVLEKDQVCPIDFRYKSALPTSHQTQDVKVADHPLLANHPMLHRLGHLLAQQADFPQRDRVYSIDAIIDIDQRLWILEMNCNPHIHPFLYESMVADMLSQRQV